jgi:hypothetical protein
MFGWFKKKSAEPARPELTDEFIGQCLDLGLQSARSGAEFGRQIDLMAEAGCPRSLAYRFVNLVPILAGRRFLASSGRPPKLADHYVLVDGRGNERAVRFAECALCRATDARLDRLDPAEMLTLGLGSCEVQALNSVLNQLGPQATEQVVASVEIEAPRMGG